MTQIYTSRPTNLVIYDEADELNNTHEIRKDDYNKLISIINGKYRGRRHNYNKGIEEGKDIINRLFINDKCILYDDNDDEKNDNDDNEYKPVKVTRRTRIVSMSKVCDECSDSESDNDDSDDNSDIEPVNSNTYLDLSIDMESDESDSD